MSVQVLVASMNQNNHDLLKKMNIQSDAIIGNQSNFLSFEEFDYNGYVIKYLNIPERGVGLNRNNSLMRASGDICVLADDDMRFIDGYVEVVEKAFFDNPKADVIIFNIKEKEPTRYINKKNHKVGKLNFFRYGAARIAFKLKPIREQGISFNLLFGGGAERSAGEDTLFLSSCIKAGLRIYTSTLYIAELLDDRDSSWFKGYDDKYLEDKGFLFKIISPRLWKALCLQDAFRHRKLYGRKTISCYRAMVRKNED